MKIVLFESVAPVPVADFMPDSALLLPGRPMFYPEDGEDWTFSLHMAVRLNRLGKNIAPKFAFRYYDAVSIALRLTLPGHPSPGLISGMDASVYCGEWLAPECFAAIKEFWVGENRVGLNFDAGQIATAINALSRLTTVKMGDVILLPPTEANIKATPRTFMEIFSPDGKNLLKLKIV